MSRVGPRWGNCWVVVVLVVELRCLGGRQVALPVLFRLFRPKDDDHGDRPSQPELARTLIDIVIGRFPGRTIELVMDGAYASRAWRGLPARVSVTTRMRANARGHELAPVRQPGQKGRPPLKGRKLATLAELAKTAVFQAVTITGTDGRQRTAHIHEFICLWYKPFYTRPVKVTLIRNPGTTEGFDVALASTDAEIPADALIARYDSRWTIETANQEAKAHGVGEARNRVERAVKRTVPFGFLVQTIIDRVVRRSRRSRSRPRPAPARVTLVPPESHGQLRRHARRAPPRTDPPRVLGTSTPDNHQPDTHTSPVTASLGGRVRSRKSRWRRCRRRE